MFKCGRQSISSGHRVGASDIFVQCSGLLLKAILFLMCFIMTECKWIHVEIMTISRKTVGKTTAETEKERWNERRMWRCDPCSTGSRTQTVRHVLFSEHFLFLLNRFCLHFIYCLENGYIISFPYYRTSKMFYRMVSFCLWSSRDKYFWKSYTCG